MLCFVGLFIGLATCCGCKVWDAEAGSDGGSVLSTLKFNDFPQQSEPTVSEEFKSEVEKADE